MLALPFPGFNLWTVSLLIRSLRPEKITRTKSTSVHFAWLAAYFQSQKMSLGMRVKTDSYELNGCIPMVYPIVLASFP